MSEEGVSVEGAGRDCSRPAGYERGSVRLILEREDEEEAIDGAISLLPEAVEKVDAIDRRDLHDEAEEEVALEEVVDVDMKEEAVELRPGESSAWQKNQRARQTYANPWLGKTFSGSFAVDVVRGGPRCVASTPLGCQSGRPWW